MKLLKQWTLFWILCASCLQLFCGVAGGAIGEWRALENLDALASQAPCFRQRLHRAETESPGGAEETRSLRDTLERMWVTVATDDREDDDWDANGWLEDRWTLAKGTTVYTRDDEDRVTNINHHGYSYNVAGWRTEQDLPTGVTSTLDHDGLGQLTEADDYNTFDFDYAYDDGWNLDFRKVDGVTEQFSTNAANELTSSPLGSATYDGNGNLTDDGNTEYTYDHENRLTQTVWQDGADYWRESYTYDGLNRLREIYRERCTDGTTWTFSSEKHLVYDGMLVVQERDRSNNVEAHHTRGSDLIIPDAERTGIGR